MTTTVRTICVECRFHNGASPDASWLSHRCFYPALEGGEKQDPVTGKIKYANEDSQGIVFLTREKNPYCRDINTGNCEYFEAK